MPVMGEDIEQVDEPLEEVDVEQKARDKITKELEEIRRRKTKTSKRRFLTNKEDYVLDSNADVDMNVVKTSDGKYVELQGTGEESTFSGEELFALIAQADAGLDALFEVQAAILDGIN